MLFTLLIYTEMINSFGMDLDRQHQVNLKFAMPRELFK